MIPDFRTPDHIVEAAAKALRDGHHGYTPANGILPLREAVSGDLHKRYGVTVSPEDGMTVGLLQVPLPVWATVLWGVTRNNTTAPSLPTLRPMDRWS